MGTLWSPAGAIGGNQRQIASALKLRKQAKSGATGCHWLPFGSHGKEATVRVRQRASEKDPHIADLCCQCGRSCVAGGQISDTSLSRASRIMASAGRLSVPTSSSITCASREALYTARLRFA